MLEWSYIGEGACWCSLNLSLSVLDDSPIYPLSHSTLSHLYLYMTPLFLRDRIFVHLSHEEVIDIHASFKVHLYPMFTACFLDVLTQPFGIRNHHVWILIVFGVVSRIVGASSVVILGWSLGPDLHSVENPCRVLTFGKSFE